MRLHRVLLELIEGVAGLTDAVDEGMAVRVAQEGWHLRGLGGHDANHLEGPALMARRQTSGLALAKVGLQVRDQVEDVAPGLEKVERGHGGRAVAEQDALVKVPPLVGCCRRGR